MGLGKTVVYRFRWQFEELPSFWYFHLDTSNIFSNLYKVMSIFSVLKNNTSLYWLDAELDPWEWDFVQVLQWKKKVVIINLLKLFQAMIYLQDIQKFRHYRH